MQLPADPAIRISKNPKIDGRPAWAPQEGVLAGRAKELQCGGRQRLR